MSTLQHEAHGSDVEEEKKSCVVIKNFKATYVSNVLSICVYRIHKMGEEGRG